MIRDSQVGFCTFPRFDHREDGMIPDSEFSSLSRSSAHPNYLSPIEVLRLNRDEDTEKYRCGEYSFFNACAM